MVESQFQSRSPGPQSAGVSELLQVKRIIQVSAHRNVRDDAAEVAAALEDQECTHRVRWAPAPRLPGEAGEHSRSLCSVLSTVISQRGKKQMTAFSKTCAFPNSDSCPENLLSRVPFPSTSLVCLGQLVAVDVFTAKGRDPWRVPDRRAVEGRGGREGRTHIGSGCSPAERSSLDLGRADLLENVLWKT